MVKSYMYDGTNAKELIDFNPSKELHWSGAIIPKSRIHLDLSRIKQTDT